jgi:hypothetical protein
MDFENGWVTDDKELVDKVRKLTFKSAMGILRAYGKARRGQTNAPHDTVLNTLMRSLLDGSIPREALEPKD